MSTRVSVNNKTVVHKKTIGIATAFPDACKTPTPGGPVPIPYPNIAMSKDAASTTTKVKVDGEGICVKGSNFMMSQGDEAGSAMGVVSNRIKGKAEFQNFSFDVKAEGKMVARLADPMTQNGGSTSNAVTPAEAQAPSAGSGAGEEKGDGKGKGKAEEAEGPEKGRHGDQKACDSLKGKKQPPKGKSMDDVFKEHGMLPEHGKAFMETCKETGKSCTVRAGNPACVDKIAQGFPTKHADVSGANTLGQAGNLPGECTGLVGKPKTPPFEGLVTADGRTIPADVLNSKRSELGAGGFNDWMKKQGAMTGDYDMHDVFDGRGRVHDGTKQAKSAEKAFQNAVNDTIGRTDSAGRMVQHGPQANFKEYLDAKGKSVPDAKASYLMPDPGQKPPKSLLHFDKNGNVYKIDSMEELDALYKCKGAKKPAHW